VPGAEVHRAVFNIESLLGIESLSGIEIGDIHTGDVISCLYEPQSTTGATDFLRLAASEMDSERSLLMDSSVANRADQLLLKLKIHVAPGPSEQTGDNHGNQNSP
jgi:hypothetical protein